VRLSALVTSIVAATFSLAFVVAVAAQASAAPAPAEVVH
jgi:VIT1/CCC1 family predicted Fe2+/Mn2+ transporter